MIIGGLIVLVLTAALVGPYFVDWTSYRADFERQASIILGRDVKVNGEARARLLPFPSVTFSDVTVAGTGGGPPAMTAEQFSMDMELAPFVRGEVLIFDMRLVRPEIRMAISETGAIDWAIRPEAYFDASRVALEKLTVVEGRLRILHAPSGREHLLTEINTDLSARALTGPWRIDGSLRVDGQRHAVNISTGTAGGDGPVRLRVRAAPERYPLVVEADGGLYADDGALRYQGTFTLGAGGQTEPQPLTEALRAPSTTAAYRLRGAFALDARRLDISEFRLETGPLDDPYTADGTAFLDLGPQPNFSIMANGAQVRIEEGPAVEGEAGGIALSQRLEGMREFLQDLPRPGIPGSIELNLPAVVAGDTTLRDIRLRAVPSEGNWQVDGLHASLPGRTTLEGRGVLRVDEELAFSGSLLLAVGQPSGFAGWLSADVTDAIRRLPAAGFSADVELSQQVQRFTDLELILGDARFRGSVEREAPDGARPSIAIDLDGSRLDVDGMMAFGSLFVGQDGYRRIGDEDIDLELKAGPVLAFGLAADSLDTALRLRREAVEIDRMMISGLEGAAISATGTLTQLGAAPTGNIDVDIVAPDLAPLASVLAQRFPDNGALGAVADRSVLYPGLLAEARVGVVVTAASRDRSAPQVAISAHALTQALDVTATYSSPALPGTADVPVELAVEASSGDAAALYALAGVPPLPSGLAGGASAELTFTGNLGAGGPARFAFRGEGLELGFDGKFTTSTDASGLQGRVDLKTDDIEPWLMTAGVALPGSGLGMPVEAQAQIDLADRLAVVSDLSGRIGGADIAGDLNVALGAAVPAVSGELDVSALDLRPVLQAVLGFDALDEADGEWPDAVFAQAPILPIFLDLALASRRATVTDGLSIDEMKGQLALNAAGLRLSGLSGTMLGGRVSGLAELANNSGSGLLSAQLRLEDGALGRVLPGGALSARADIGASVTASGKTVEAMVASLAGSGTLSYRDLEIAGINPDPFAAIIAGADRIGRDIDAVAVAGFAPDLLEAGTLQGGSGEVAFSIANGVLRAPPVRLETETVDVTADLRLDIAGRTVAAEATVEYVPGNEELVGSAPVVRFVASGPIAQPSVEIDTAPLAQFLTQRALEIEQRRVEAMQAVLLEGQRLRREVRYYAALEEARVAAEQERLRQEAERLRLEEEARLRAEEERRAQEEARLRAEEEARRAAEEAARAQQAPPLVLPQSAPPPQTQGSSIIRLPLPADRPAASSPPAAPSGAFSPDNLRIGVPTDPLRIQ